MTAEEKRCTAADLLHAPCSMCEPQWATQESHDGTKAAYRAAVDELDAAVREREGLIVDRMKLQRKLSRIPVGEREVEVDALSDQIDELSVRLDATMVRYSAALANLRLSEG